MAQPPEDEQHWVEQARQGDRQAFARLYEMYHASAFGAAVLITRDRALAADVVQETFIRALLAMPRFRPGQPFRPWLFRILTNEALRLMKRRRLLGLLGLRQREEPAPLPTPEMLAVDRERAREIWQAICDLPDVSRAAVVLRYYVGLSEEEMTRILGIPAGTVKSRLARAKERLRPALSAALKEEEQHV